MTERGGGQAEEGKSPILCLLHCLPVLSLPLSSYLAILPLTSNQRPFTFFISFVVLPPSQSLFIFFILSGIHSDMVAPPLFLNLPCSTILWLYLYIRKHCLVLFFPLYQTSLLFHLALSIKMETHFWFLSVHSDSTTNTTMHASVNNVRTNLNKSEGLQRQCPCSTLPLPGAPLLRESLICEGFICTKPLLQTLLP